MSAFVLDASTVLAWLLKDDRAAQAEALVRRGMRDGAAAPRLMLLEVPNGLRNRLRRGQIAHAKRDGMLADLLGLPIEWDDDVDAWALVRLSDLHDLTVCDAAYLDVASRLRLPLATLDQRLARAAVAAGVAVVP